MAVIYYPATFAPFNAQSLLLTGPVPFTGANQFALGAAEGFGNGSSGTTVTTTALGTGTGPANPQIIAGYVQASWNGSTIWLPFMQ